jgi:dynein heavy chain
MFNNISGLRLEADSHDRPFASAMVSCEGEAMEFREPVLAVGRVEDWMSEVVQGMRIANRYSTKKAIYDYGKLRRPR